MKRITFKFRDSQSNWEWITRSCIVESLDECIRIYGLNDSDVEWVLVSMEEV